jgi:chorismate synthase
MSAAVGFLTNHSGGIIGGISTGQEIIFRVVVKPTSSISVPQKTINIKGEDQQIRIEGRHDPCICPRTVPVARGHGMSRFGGSVQTTCRNVGLNEKTTTHSK